MFDWLRSRNPGAKTSAREAAERCIAEGRRKEDEGRLPEACELYRQAVAVAPDFAKAHLNLGIGLAAAGDTEGALRSYESAMALEPGEPYACYNLGCLLFARGELARAEELLRAALARKPDFPEAHVALSNVHDARGDASAATAALEAALAQRPDFAGAWHNYGLLLTRQGRLADAERALRRAGADSRPALATVLNALGVAHAVAGRLDAAEGAFTESIEQHGEQVEAYMNLSLLLRRSGRVDEAQACLRRGLAHAPAAAPLHFHLGETLQQAGRMTEAVAAFREATRLQPGYFAAHYSLAIALREQGAHKEALACVETLMRMTPRSADEHACMANVLRDADRTEDVLAELRRALALEPEHAHARWALAMQQLPAVYPDEAAPAKTRAAFAAELAALDTWTDAARAAQAVDAVGAHHPFLLAYQEENNRELMARYGRICSRVMSEWARRERLAAPRPRAPRRPLRVGVVSQFFWNHSVWNAIVRGWFEHLDPQRIALHAFYLGTRQDEETRFARARAARFESVSGGLRGLADAVLAQELDALVYPEIGMHPMTLRLAALRLAPLQVLSWGHPETSGLPSIDYYLSGADFEPPGAHAHYTETLVPLPNLGCCYSVRRVEPEKPDLAALGVDGGAPIFICPGTPFKYAPAHDGVFAGIARRLGRCTFVFFSHQVNPRVSDKLRARLEAVFRREGLRADDFVRFIPWQSGAQFYGLMRRADAFLDTIGFSGFNTAMQAVECALPIVTREGRFMRGRFASAILKRIGLGELVAQTDDEYRELAVRLARDGAYRAGVRRQIEERRAPLFDDVATVRALEDFLIRSAGPRPG